MEIGSNELILVVEDNKEDYFFVERAVKEAGLPNPVMQIEEGDLAMDYLFGEGEFSEPGSYIRPGIIILDLHLPGAGGKEILARLKKDEAMEDIPVIILTSSEDERDIKICKEAGADTYLNKPATSEAFIDSVRRLKKYWFQAVRLNVKDDFFNGQIKV